MGWRLDAGSLKCDDNAIASQSPGYKDGTWKQSGRLTYSAINETTEIICTAYDITENWQYGFNSFVATVSASGPFHIR